MDREAIARVICLAIHGNMGDTDEISWAHYQQHEEVETAYEAADAVIAALSPGDVPITDRTRPIIDIITAYGQKVREAGEADVNATETVAAILAAASPPAPVSGWRDIATAPKDGTDLLLAGAVPEGWRVTVGHWTTDEECRTPIGDCGGECRCIEYDYHDPSWISWDGGFCDPWPATHWQPLPAPPEQASTPQQGEGGEAYAPDDPRWIKATTNHKEPGQ